jgi:uncharacterized protein (TIGR03437 family)
MKACLFLLIFCAFSLFGDAQPPSQVLVYEDGFPAKNYQFQQFLDTIQPIRWALTEPASPVPAQIIVKPSTNNACGNYAYCSGVSTIYMPTVPVMENEPWNGGDYNGFLHELMHQSLPIPVFIGLDLSTIEGLATAKSGLIYMEFAREYPQLFTWGLPPTTTCASGIDVINNAKIITQGGARYFYNNRNWGDLPACPLLALFVNKLGGNFRVLDHAINVAQPQSRGAFLQLIDTLADSVDGVKPSTFFGYDPMTFSSSPDGTDLGVMSLGGMSKKWGGIDNAIWPFNPFGYFAAATQFKDGVPTLTSSAIIWSLFDASGIPLVKNQPEMTSRLKSVEFGENATLNPNHKGGGEAWWNNYPDGAYRFVACLADAHNTCKSDSDKSDSESQDSAVFAIYHEQETLDNGDVAIIVNGPRWGNLTADRTLTVLSKDFSGTIETYPGLYIFRGTTKKTDGSYSDLTVTDGTYVRTFTPDQYAPSVRFFKRRDEPMLFAISRATDYAVTDVVAPGGLYSLWGWAFTNNDPVAASTVPIPTQGCPGTARNEQGPTYVSFTTSSGTEYDAPILYCGSKQINFQVPAALTVGETVRVAVVLDGTASKSLPVVVVASDPSAFLAGGSTPTMYFATGRKSGQLITSQDPAAPGDTITLFGTGLGAYKNPLPDGKPAAQADPAVIAVTITVAGMPAKVAYAGSAPGFVGLDQINFVVPAGASGLTPLTIIAATGRSYQSTLAAR